MRQLVMHSAKTCGTLGAGTVSKKAGIDIFPAYPTPECQF